MDLLVVYQIGARCEMLPAKLTFMVCETQMYIPMGVIGEDCAKSLPTEFARERRGMALHFVAVAGRHVLQVLEADPALVHFTVLVGHGLVKSHVCVVEFSLLFVDFLWICRVVRVSSAIPTPLIGRPHSATLALERFHFYPISRLKEKWALLLFFP